MKRIWMRFGMDVELSDEEYNELLEAKNQGDYSKIENIFFDMFNKGELSGESYILGKQNGGVEDYDNPEEEISVLF